MSNLRQSATNAVASGQSRTCTVNLTNPTLANNLVVVVAVGALAQGALYDPAGFVDIAETTHGDLRMAVWAYEGAPSMNSVSITTSVPNRAFQVRVLELNGARPSGALDQVTILHDADDLPNTGVTGTTAQNDEIVLGFVANRFGSTTQAGFSGGLTRLFETLTPASYSTGGDNDADDLVYDDDQWGSRLTVHQQITTTIGNFFLQAQLSCARDWIGILCTFRGSSAGPALLSSLNSTRTLTTSGTGTLTSFGPLTSLVATQPAILTTGGRGDMYPFDYQYRLNNGLVTIGASTQYLVESVEGLEGWQLRTSDNDQPRNDGAIRGVDLQSARQIVFKLGTGQGDAFRSTTEALLAVLYRALVPQRDSDWELVWRHPGRPVRVVRCRPTDLIRGLDSLRALYQNQQFALRCADPRQYSPTVTVVTIPVSVDPANPTTVNVANAGNAPAYPLIRVVGPASGPPATRIYLVNSTSKVTFDVKTVLATGSVLVGDMGARVTASPTSAITVNGQSKYGSWQFPRDPFRIDADPTGTGGYNVLYLTTEPAGIPVTATIEFRDTWAG